MLIQEIGYPFNGEVATTWYDKWTYLFTKVNLVIGLTFLSIFIYAIWSTFKKKESGLIISLSSIVFLLAIMFVSMD